MIRYSLISLRGISSSNVPNVSSGSRSSRYIYRMFNIKGCDHMTCRCKY
jgi:hypothetical protein